MAIDLSRDGYTHEQVKNVLHMTHGSRTIRFRYFVLDKNERELGELKSVISGSIEQSAFAAIKRTATFSMKDTTYTHNQTGEKREINWNTDRIQVFVEFKMPDEYKQESTNREEWYFVSNAMVSDQFNDWKMTKKEGGWVSFSLGIFLLSTPVKKEQGPSIYRDVSAYDSLLIVKEDKVTDRYTIRAGTRYYDAMVSLLNSAVIQKLNIENDDKTLPTYREYDPGTEKLAIINDLASELGFTQLWVDEYGYFRANRYRSPADQPSDYTYEDNEISVMFDGSEEELDLFNLPNVFTAIVANPDTDEEYISTVENNNPNHPRSIPSLGRRVVRVEEKDNIADQEALDAYIERIADETSQIFGRVTFTTAIMPFHSYSNIITFRNKTLGISEKYSETNWSLNLEPGAEMVHEARRTVRLV